MPERTFSRLSSSSRWAGDDLGGNVWKKRLNENRCRAILATKPGEFWIFMYVFAKSDRENVGPVEHAAFKKLAADFCAMGTAGIEELAADGTLMEICE